MSEITTAATEERRDSATIVDVREPDETAAGMIPGAVNIPLGQLTSRLGELEAGRPVITVCAAGPEAPARPATCWSQAIAPTRWPAA